MTRAVRLATAFWRDDQGQDLIEYALLTAIIGVAGALVLPGMAAKMGVAYSNWNAAAQAAWEPCPPGGCP